MRVIRGPWPWIIGFALLVWAIEVVFSGGIPRDQAEAVFWGREWVSVSQKHPTLSGWIHMIWLWIFGNSALSGHAIGAVNALLSAALLAATLRRMGFGRDARAIALWSAFASFNYYLLLIKYNANAAPVPFWLLGILGLWVGVAERKMWGWALAGIAAGLAMLAKYHSAVWLGSAFLWLLSGPVERRVWRSAGPWVALALFAALFVPHLVQLAHWDWPGLSYGASNLTSETRAWGHFWEPLRYALTQLLFAGPGLWVLLWGLRRATRGGLDLRGRFLLAFGVVFPLAPMAVAVVTGGALGSIWGIGTALLTAPFLLHLTGQATEPTAALQRLMARAGKIIFMALALLLIVAQPFRAPEYPMQAAMEAVEEALGTDEARVALVHGVSREAQGATWYLPSRPRYLRAAHWSDAPWVARHISVGDMILIERDMDSLAQGGWQMRALRSFDITLPPRDDMLFPTRGYTAHWILAEVTARPEVRP